MNYIEIVSTGILALGCIILALLLRDHKATVLQYAAQLVQSAEQAIQGSGMGAEKKALVLAQLEAAAIRINTWLSVAIDRIVEHLNDTGAWMASQAREHAAGLGEEENAE